jgi:hypothetical protein
VVVKLFEADVAEAEGVSCCKLRVQPLLTFNDVFAMQDVLSALI